MGTLLERVRGLGLTFGNHGGAGNPSGGTAPGSNEVMVSELSALSHVSPINQLVFGGVFERHPKLRLVLTELPGTWWPYTLNELDSIYLLNTARMVPSSRSAYRGFRVTTAASTCSWEEASWRVSRQRDAVAEGYESNVIWGSDYPHAEGTFQYPDSWDDEPLTRVAMRHTFAGIEAGATRLMVGENAVRAYGLDGAALADVAARIGARSGEGLAVPVDDIPTDGGLLAFRQVGAWA
jgi:predicted TIM-barrel fold metal-dependent hydrolase